jgi:tetratricopeptide (TPR) repeat protein/SAM-dependent methyltransferase
MVPKQEMTIDQTIALARQAGKSGRSAEAERALRQVVAMRPGYVPALLALGEVLYARRDFAGAVLVFEDAADAMPENLDLKMHLGNALHMAGRPADAIGVFGAVANLKPDHWLAFNNLGSAWQALSQFDKAADAYQLSLNANPTQFLANFNLGMMFLAEQKFAGAAQLLARAVAADASHVSALHHLGVALLFQRKHAQAETIFRAVLKIDGKQFATLRSLGMLLAELARRPEALAVLRSAAAINPNDAQTLSLIGNILLGMGKTEEGVASLKSALELDAKLTDARVLLVNTLIEEDDRREATRVAFAGLSLTPENHALRIAAVDAMGDAGVSQATPPVRAMLLRLINDPAICTQDLARVVIDLARHAPYFKPLLEAARRGADVLADPAAQELMSDELLLAALPRILVADAEMELVLTALRRAFLLRVSMKGYPFNAPEGANGPFLAALARQCYTSEYVAFVSSDEQKKLDVLKSRIEGTFAAGDLPPKKIEWPLGVYALYAPLTTLMGWRLLLDIPLGKWSEPLGAIVREQAVDKQLEVALTAGMPTLTAIEDTTSKEFRRLYDANPYPRWRSMTIPVPESIEALAARLRPTEPVPVFPRPTPVLIAGCGTGHHPIQTAMRFPQAQVTALDISAVSLGYAARMAEQLSVRTILWRQGDLLELGKIEQKFALIECGGVLHHVKDPEAGLGALRDRLMPGGVLKVSVYSRAARRHVGPARDFIGEKGFPDTAQGIRAARHAILALPEKSPERGVAFSPDFYASSTCRFLAFPVEEHTFTLPQLAEMIANLGLRFLGFDLPARSVAGFRAVYPKPESLTDLAAWANFEAAEPLTFDQMYQLWLDVKTDAKLA